MYYQDKLTTLSRIFGTQDIRLTPTHLVVAGKEHPIVDDVIILSDAGQYTDKVRSTIEVRTGGGNDSTLPAQEFAEGDFAEEIQYSFGDEWQAYDRILPEHEQEFRDYFDLIDLDSLRDKTVCDLGCGSGRWSHFVSTYAKEMILVDFSDAIFIARRNLKERENALFFMCDIKTLPFADDFADFLFCLGVLHHLPTPCISEVAALGRFSPKLLIYLYYALDNRPFYFRIILRMVTALRLRLSKIRNPAARTRLSKLGAYTLYKPLVILGGILRPLGLSRSVPLYETYRGKSMKRIEQDVYDRFFTNIEQRVTRKEILALEDHFDEVVISEGIPYYHFLCVRGARGPLKNEGSWKRSRGGFLR